MQGKSDDISFHLLHQDFLLAGICNLEQLLDSVIAKHIGHKLVGLRHHLVEQRVAVGGSAGFEALLDEAGSVLIAAELHHIAEDFLCDQYMCRQDTKGLTLMYHVRCSLFNLKSSNKALLGLRGDISEKSRNFGLYGALVRPPRLLGV